MPTMKEIRDIARQLGIRSTRMEKASSSGPSSGRRGTSTASGRRPRRMQPGGVPLARRLLQGLRRGGNPHRRRTMKKHLTCRALGMKCGFEVHDESEDEITVTIGDHLKRRPRGGIHRCAAQEARDLICWTRPRRGRPPEKGTVMLEGRARVRRPRPFSFGESGRG